MRSSRALRRNSGEIINATLLEVFLALTFIVFALAVFEREKADAAESRREALEREAAANAAAAAQLKATRDSLHVLRLTAAAQGDSVYALTRMVQSYGAQFLSTYEPDCDGGPAEGPWIEVMIDDSPILRARVRSSRLGFAPDEEIVVAQGELVRRFAAVRAYQADRGCQFRAQIIDRSTSKAAYKRALASVRQVFRLRGILQ